MAQKDMTYKDFYNKVGDEANKVQRYMIERFTKSNTTYKFNSSIFQNPSEISLSNNLKNTFYSKAGIYLFMCDAPTNIDIIPFNNVDHSAPIRMYDGGKYTIVKNEINYVGEASNVSSRMSAHLQDSQNNTTVGLRLENANRSHLKQNSRVIVFYFKDTMKICENDQQGIDNKYAKFCRETIETMLKAKFNPCIGR